VRKIIVLLLIVILVFLIGCVAKQIQREVPVVQEPISQEPVKNVSIEPSPIVPQEVKPVEEVKPPEFVSEMNCTAGTFNFKVTNIGDENLSISKIVMHIKGGLFFPKCDVAVLELGESTMCSQSYYSSIVGSAAVTIKAKIGKTLADYIQTVPC
jgi:Na+-transporting methylmalonyl-CoA/oxaloacetate decarboxylase gamma subunit